EQGEHHDRTQTIRCARGSHRGPGAGDRAGGIHLAAVRPRPDLGSDRRRGRPEGPAPPGRDASPGRRHGRRTGPPGRSAGGRRRPHGGSRARRRQATARWRHRQRVPPGARVPHARGRWCQDRPPGAGRLPLGPGVQRAGHLSTDPRAAVRLSTVTTDPIALIPIDASNWRTAARLRPAPEQERFLAPNWYSLLEATYDPLMRPLLAVADEEPVGFVMYGFEPEEDQPWVYRLMVAPAHQGRGGGREIMRQTIERIRQEHPGHAIGVSYEPDNERAARLYESLGFEHHGRFIEGEKVVRLPAATDGTPDTTRSSFEGFLTRYLRAWRERRSEERRV